MYYEDYAHVTYYYRSAINPDRKTDDNEQICVTKSVIPQLNHLKCQNEYRCVMVDIIT